MGRTSLENWKKRISDKKASGLNLADWCEKNNVTRYAYYYWKKRVEASASENSTLPDAVLFAELPILTEQLKSTEASRLLISWKDLQITVSSVSSAELAAEFMSQLLKRC